MDEHIYLKLCHIFECFLDNFLNIYEIVKFMFQAETTTHLGRRGAEEIELIALGAAVHILYY